MNRLVVACAALSSFALVAIAGDASADEKGTTTLPVTTVHGRRAHPGVTIEIARARMTLPPRPLERPHAAAPAAKKAPL